MVKIVTDSVSDIPSEAAQELGITVVPLYVHFGTEVYRDRVDLSTEEFYRKLAHSQILPTTSAPGPGVFAEVFNRLAEETDEILAIFISSKFSGTYESALQGKAIVKGDCRVEVIDSMSAIGGLMLLAIFAAELAKAGADLNQITARVREAIPKTHVRMCFDTLEYLRRGGRIGKAQALLGSLLKVNPILGIKDGEAFPYGRTRSRLQAIGSLCRFAEGFEHIRGLVVEYATTPDDAEAMIERLGAKFPKERIYKSTVSPVVGTHVGPHVLAVSVLEEEH
ncbi:MAG: DegV family protein [bacterium]